MERGTPMTGEPGSPLDHRRALGCAIDGAHHNPTRKVLAYRLLFSVRRSPDRALCAVQDSRGNRTEGRLSKRSVAIGRHHDQVHALSVDEPSEELNEIAQVCYGFHGELCE